MIENNKDKYITIERVDFEHMNEELDAFRTIFGSYSGLVRDNEVNEIVKYNDEVHIVFEFDWEHYHSWIVIKGINNKQECKIKTPQIPLIGGCWSNLVATRCMTGQALVSAMLESVLIQVQYIAKSFHKDVNIVKCDNCFYAPFLFYTVDKNGRLCSGLEENTHEEYHDILKKQNPEAYKQICEIKKDENYWNKYHDKPLK